MTNRILLLVIIIFIFLKADVDAQSLSAQEPEKLPDVFAPISWTTDCSLKNLEKLFPNAKVVLIGREALFDSFGVDRIVITPSPLKLPFTKDGLNSDLFIVKKGSSDVVLIYSEFGKFSRYNQKLMTWFLIMRDFFQKKYGKPVDAPKFNFEISDERQKVAQWKLRGFTLNLELLAGTEEYSDWELMISATRFQ